MIAARTVGGLANPGIIEEVESDLTEAIEDFDRAVNVEALRRIKETGEHLLLAMVRAQLLCYRAGASAWAAEICRDNLPPRFPLHEWHPRGPPQTSHRLGDQRTRGGEQYILDLRLARNRENVVSTFDLRDPPRGKSPRWHIFLPEG